MNTVAKSAMKTTTTAKATAKAAKGGAKGPAAGVDLSRARWRKAAASGGSNGGCVEVAANLPGVAAVRDSTRPGDGVHIVTHAAFAAFLGDLRAGKYDLAE